jgi:hypothetical protein
MLLFTCTTHMQTYTNWPNIYKPLPIQPVIAWACPKFVM